MDNELTFSLEGHPYVQLYQLLKIMSVADSGGQAKLMIENGDVLVNDQIETRKRCKIVAGQRIRFFDIEIQVNE